jgi:hypothetical protein
MRMWLVALAASSVIGCWTGPVAPPPGGPTPHAAHHDVPPRSEFEDVLVRFEGIVDQMCDCHTKECADALSPELSAWAQELSQTSELHPTEDETERMASLSQRYAQCVNNAMSAGPPTP